MSESIRDLPSLLDYTGYALIVGGKNDGAKYWLFRMRKDEHWSRVDDWWQDQLELSDIQRAASVGGGQVVAVLPERGPAEPPEGSEVRMRHGTDVPGVSMTRSASGWWWKGEPVTWDRWWKEALRLDRHIELLALPKCKETASSLHLGAKNESPRHCCDMMQDNVELGCEQHPTGFGCADQLLHHNRYGEYGLIIHDGGESYVLIQFCPWCGVRLPASRRGVETE